MLWIIGSSGHAQVVAEAASLIGIDYRYVAREPLDFTKNFVTEDEFEHHFQESDQLICGVGSTGDVVARLSALERYSKYQANFANVVHPRAFVAPSATIGKGVFIAMGAHVGTGAKIADQVIVNSAAAIDHHCVIGRGTHVAPGAILCGNVVCGENVHVGAGATVKQNCTINDGNVIGAGAVVVSNIMRSGQTFVGVPATSVD